MIISKLRFWNLLKWTLIPYICMWCWSLKNSAIWPSVHILLLCLHYHRARWLNIMWASKWLDIWSWSLLASLRCLLLWRFLLSTLTWYEILKWKEVFWIVFLVMQAWNMTILCHRHWSRILHPFSWPWFRLFIICGVWWTLWTASNREQLFCSFLCT